MTNDEKLQKIRDRAKCGVYLTFNEHRDIYMKVDEFLETNDFYDVDDAVRVEMQKKDSMVRLQVYPDTPIGFHVVHHWSLEGALDEMIELLEQEKEANHGNV